MKINEALQESKNRQTKAEIQILAVFELYALTTVEQRMVLAELLRRSAEHALIDAFKDKEQHDDT